MAISVRVIAWLCLLALLIDKAHSQAIDGCYTTADCSGAAVTDTTITDAQSCCIADNPLSYSSGGSCLPCQVYGWQSNEVTLEEDGQQVQVSVGFIKGPIPSGITRLSVSDSPGTAEKFIDYTPPPMTTLIIRRGISPPMVTISAQGDQVSQEGSETFTVNLSPVGTQPMGYFFRSTLTAVINDDTEVAIEWTELDYGAPERVGRMRGLIRPSVQIASPITLNVIPLTYDQVTARGFTLPTNLPTASDVNDFDTMPFEVTIPPSTSAINEVELFVDVIDDLRDETNEEGFLVLLELSSASYPTLVTFDPVKRITLARVLDNDDPLIGFEFPSYTFPELASDSPQTIRLMKETESDLTLVVMVSIEAQVPPDATAADSGADYSLITTQQYTFEPADMFQDIDLSILADSFVERREGFVLGVNGVVGTPTVLDGQNPTTNVYITDTDEVVVGFDMTQYDIVEDVGTVDVCVRVFSPPVGELPDDVTINVLFSTMPGTAGADDFTSVSDIPVSFTNTEELSCISVTVAVDTIGEPDEEFTASLTPVSPTPDFPPIRIDPAQASITIQDDDVVEVEFDPTTYTVNEGMEAEIIVVLRGNSVIPITVNFQTQDGTAENAAGDYTSVTRTLTFNPGETSQTVAVPTLTDQSAEGTEQFTAVLTNPSQGAVLGDDTASVDIEDSSDVLIEFDPTSFSVDENVGVATFTIVKRTPTTREVSVLFSTQDGTATVAGSDYTAIQDTLVTFAPSEDTQMVAVTINNDAIFEDNEIFQGLLSLPTGSTGVALGTDVAMATIIDDDGVTIGFEFPVYTTSEPSSGAQTTQEVYMVLISGTIGREFYVVPRHVPGTAAEGVPSEGGDYVPSAGDYMFSPTVSRSRVDIFVFDDSLAEGTEQFTIEVQGLRNERGGDIVTSIPGVTINPLTTTVIVEDNDLVEVEFDPTTYTVNEGMEAEIIVVLRGNSVIPITVNFQTQDGTAENAAGDYTSVTRTLTFSPGETSQTVAVPTLTDQSAESTEQFMAVLTNPSQGAVLGDDTASVDIEDSSDVLIEFDPTSFSVDENVGVATFTIVKRTPTTREVSVLFSTQDGTATVAGSDYTAIQDTLVTFAPSEDTQMVAVTINNDAIFEDNEVFQGLLSLPTGSTGVALGTDVAMATIIDDDGVLVDFDPASYTVTEGGVVNFMVVLTGEADVSVMVDFSTIDGTAIATEDYTAVPSMTLTFNPGETTILVPVQTTQDTVAESEETFQGSLTTSQERVSVGVAMATATITDDDEVTIGFDPVSYSVMEGMNAQLIVVLSDPSAVPVTVDIQTMDGSATVPGDYTSVTRTLTFNPGETSQTVTVPTLSDQSAESTEQFTAVLTNPSQGAVLGDDTASVDIEDTTDVVIEFDPVVYMVTEGVDRNVRFTVVKRTPTSRSVQVLFNTADVTAIAPGDYTSRSDIVVDFLPADTQQIVEVTISNDVVFEGDESFIGRLSLPAGSMGVMIGADVATATIADDDSVTIGFERETYTTQEPSTGSNQESICIVVTSGRLDQSITIQPEWIAGSAIADTDYRAPSGTYTLEPGPRPRACLSLTVLSDSLLEEQENLMGRLRGVLDVGGQVNESPDRVTFEPQETTILINDDINDRVTVGFEFSSYTTSEPSSGVQTTLEVCMVLVSGTIGREFYVVPEFVEGTALEGVPSQDADYVPAVNDFFFSPTDSRSCVDVFVFDDNLVEGTEQFSVQVEGVREVENGDIMSSIRGVTVNPSTTTVTIEDNDDLVVGFELESYTFLEPNPGQTQRTEEVCVIISEGNLAADSTLTVTPTFTAGSATLNVDYRPPVGQSYQFTSGSRRECLDITILNDVVFELPEDLSVEITNVLIDGDVVLGTPLVTAQPRETNIVIQDTEAVTVGFEFPTYTFQEPTSSFVQRPICMVLSGQVAFDLTLAVNWVPGTAIAGAFGADYNPASNSYLFRQGTTRSCVDIQIFRDNAYEPDEDFFGQFRGIQLPSGTLEPAVPGITVQPASTTVTIEDIDELTIGFVMESYTFSEPPVGSSRQNQPICIEVKSGSVGIPIIVEVDWIAGTAFEGPQDDYLRPTNSYSIQPTERMSCVDLVILNDIFLENTETLEARLLRVTDMQGNVLVDRLTLDPERADIAITDNDPIEIGFERPAYTVTEPPTAVQTTVEVCMIVVRGSVGRELIVVPDWREGTATQGVPSQGGDYIPALNNFVFTPGSTRACVDVFVFSDLRYETTEEFFGEISGFLDPSGTQVPALNGVTVQPDSTTIVIQDQDSVTIGFVNDRETFSEPGVGVSQSREMICIEVKDGVLGTPLTISPQFTAGTATEGFGGDYIEPSSTQSFTLDIGDTTDCIELTILNDNLFEPTEDLTGRLTGFLVDGDAVPSLPRVTLQPVEIPIDIEDNDEVTIGFTEPSYTVTESTTGFTTVSVCIEVTGGTLGRQLRVIPDWPGDSATEGTVSTGGDYSPEDGNYILNPGDTMACMDILVHNDNLFEEDELFNGQLVGFVDDGGFTVTTLNGVTLNPDQTQVTIVDSDVITVGFEEERYSFSEPETGDGSRVEMVCVVVSGSELTAPIRLQAQWTDGTATVDEDYTTTLDQFTVEAGETRNCVPVNILEDDQVENLENFLGRIVGVVDPQGNVLPSIDRVTFDPRDTDISIIDMNMAVIGFEQPEYNVTEGDGFLDVVVLVRNGELSRPISVTVTAVDNSATDPEDYTFQTRTLTFMSPLTVRQTIRVFIMDDTIDDNDEDFSLTLSVEPADQDSVQLAPENTIVGIIDDDVFCDDLSELENGMITYTNQETPRPAGTVANHVCDEGFVLVGVAERTCLQDGEFSDSPPICQPIVCDELGALENGMIVYSPDNTGPEYDLRTVASYSCNEGFELIGDDTRTCEDVGNGVTGDFSGTAPICEPITCEDLPDIENGEISYSSVESPRPVDTVATYTCTEGFMLVGSANRTCQNNGNFSGMEPICSMIPVCQDLPVLENGEIVYSSEESPRAVGTVATHRCNDGFVLMGVENRTCQESTEFTDSPPTCEPIVCDELGTLENGMIEYGPDNTGPEYDLGTVATYSCNEGFELVGPNETRTCEDVGSGVSGDFSGTAPTCEPVTCEDLPDIENGEISYSSVDSPRPVDTVATYTCTEGFMLVGSANRTCQNNGNFSGMEPICSMIPVCQDLPVLENGEIVYSSEESPRAVGTVATHRCNEGFVLMGVENRTCQESTEFTDSPPTCEPIVCDELGALENGMIVYSPDNTGPEYDLGTVASYSCDEGFELIGDDTRTCEDVGNGVTGDFSGTAPTCEPITCEDLPDIENGEISYSSVDSPRPIDTVATYTCTEGFMLVGSANRTCQNNGNFSGMEPICSMIPVCQDLPLLENGEIVYSSEESPRAVGTVATHRCNEGFVLMGVENRTCQESTEFTDSPPTCEPIVCDELVALENGMIVYSPDNTGPEYDIRTMASYSCDEGFELIGDDTRTCEDVGNGVTGDFSGTAPTCEPITCEDIPGIENGEISYSSVESPRPVDTVATYTCTEGFMLVGSANRTCQNNGNFSGMEPICSMIPVCQDLPVLENGEILYSSEESPRAVGTIATHRCNEGFVLMGVENRTCQESTEFTDSPPTCEPIVCDELGALENGMIVYDPDNAGPEYDLGTVASYSCNEGFELIGDDTRTCEDVGNGVTGDFSGTAPTCEPITCDDLPDIENGEISYSSVESPRPIDTVATYTCTEGFMLVGSANRTCQNNGNFSGMEPICSMIPVCQDLPVLENGEIVYSSEESPRAVGTVATHRCNEGFVLMGVENRTCQESTEFTDSPPTCEPIVCDELGALENGMIVYGPDNAGPEYDLGTVASYSCDEGFELVGDDTSTCEDAGSGVTGEFSGPAPTCEPIVCDELEALENGMIVYSPDNTGPEYDLGTVATYSCDEGFVLVGPDSSRTCLLSYNEGSGSGFTLSLIGSFSGTAPTCQPIVCDELGTLENGMIVYSPDNTGPEYDLGTVASYSCDEGFELVGDDTRTCEDVGNGVTGDFNGTTPICEPITCEDLPDIENGEITYSSVESPRPVDTVATYTCTEGFMLIGSANRTCQNNGNFSGMEPICSMIPVCQDLPVLENGEIVYSSEESPRAVGTVATHRCNEGFVLMGVENRTCQESTEFTDSPPTCEPIVCDELGTLENGMIVYSPDNTGPEYDLGTQATYSCNEGFVLVGPNETRLCEDVGNGVSGDFSGIAPTCEPITCEDLPDIENGEITYSSVDSPRPVDTVATYTCTGGFMLVGSANRTCQNNGNFSGMEPICSMIPVCQDLPVLENGEILYSSEESPRAVGTVATHRCNEGFVLMGVENRTCQESTEFTDSPPTCEPIVCDELGALENGMIAYNPDNTGPEYDLGTVASYSCDEGFELIGDDTRTCEDVGNGVTGDFSGTAPTCEPITCEDLPDIENGEISYSTVDSPRPVDTVATYTCTEGFMLVGSASRTCQNNGNFSGMEPICSMIPVCQDLPVLENGEIVYSSNESPRAVGTVATHRCNDGFVLTGVENRTCQESTEFTDSPPTCEPIVCDELGALENGMIVYSPDNAGPEYDLGTVASYSCDEGFELVGDDTRTCEDAGSGVTGEFSGTAPTCEPIVCDELEALENGMIVYSPDNTGPEYDLGTVATYSCDEGFVLVGPDSSRTCLLSYNEGSGSGFTLSLIGSFSGTAPTCQPIVCDELGALENGMIVYGPDNTGPEYDLGTVATYSCNEGFELIGNDTRTCEDVGNGATGDFSGTAPTCGVVAVTVTVMFVEAEYIFSEDGIYGRIQIATSGGTMDSIDVDIVGGPSTQPGLVPSLQAINSTYTFPASENASVINIMLRLIDDDIALEEIERVALMLILPEGITGVELGEPSTMYINVMDDDVVVIELEDSVVSVKEDDGTFMTCVTKDTETIRPLEVEIKDSPRSATENADYKPFIPSLKVTLEADANMTCFNGEVIDDLIALEGIEDFQLELVDPMVDAVLVGDDRTTVEIIDNDVVTTTIAQPEIRVQENVGLVTLCVNKDLETSELFNVTLTVLDGTATRGEDFVSEEKFIVTLDTKVDSTSCINIEIMNDAVFESAENFQVVLSVDSNNTDIQTGETNVSTVIIDDRGPEVPFVNDTVVGDPLFTVPLTNANFNGIDLNIEGQPSLCFEIHGDANQYFNLLTDNCVSVNARYNALNEYWNVINRIGVRAVDDMGQCRNVSVDLEGCSASVDGVALTSNYRSAGIFIRPYRNHVRVSVPNCNGSSHLVMYIYCQQNLTVWDPFTDEPFTASMIRYVIAHGINLNENSHGLLGQFWNVPIDVTEYTGPINDPDTNLNRFEIAVTHPDSSGMRRFTGLLSDTNWEFQKTPCFYVGNIQGGPIYEVEDPNDSVIEGGHEDYRMDGAFDTSYMYSRFDDSQCTS